MAFYMGVKYTVTLPGTLTAAHMPSATFPRLSTPRSKKELQWESSLPSWQQLAKNSKTGATEGTGAVVILLVVNPAQHEGGSPR